MQPDIGWQMHAHFLRQSSVALKRKRGKWEAFRWLASVRLSWSRVATRAEREFFSSTAFIPSMSTPGSIGGCKSLANPQNRQSISPMFSLPSVFDFRSWRNLPLLPLRNLIRLSTVWSIHARNARTHTRRGTGHTSRASGHHCFQIPNSASQQLKSRPFRPTSNYPR